MNTFQLINETLNQDFIRVNEIARVLSIGLETGQNVLLYGPGGHGKSEMVESALSAIFNEDQIFLQSFGEGMSEDRLFGGIDLKALERDGVIRYFPENSFLAAEIAVFEEMLDAPTVVLLALKDTLQRRQLSNGSQRYAMRTKCVIALTNKEPKEIEESGPAARALMERFPLRLEVKWASYKGSDYKELIEKVETRIEGAHLNGHAGILSELLAKAGEMAGYPISPRTAIHAVRIVKKAAQMRGATHVEREDMLDLRFLPGMEAIAATIGQELKTAYARAESENLMREAWGYFREFEAQVESATSPIKLLQLVKELSSFEDEVAELRVSDERYSDREALVAKIAELKDKAQQAALENTRTEGGNSRLMKSATPQSEVRGLPKSRFDFSNNDEESEPEAAPAPKSRFGGNTGSSFGSRFGGNSASKAAGTPFNKKD